eukprot:scaffold2628_cov113-Isochrysis_galbana.AAC.1
MDSNSRVAPPRRLLLLTLQNLPAPSLSLRSVEGRPKAHRILLLLVTCWALDGGLMGTQPPAHA